jgi:hypothetical protein
MEENVEVKETKKKVKKKKSVIGKIFDVVISVIVFGIMFVWIFDFFSVYNDKEPKFCLEREIREYEDGSTTVCTGLGYKVYQYDRYSIEGSEFGPFWMEERQ